MLPTSRMSSKASDQKSYNLLLFNHQFKARKRNKFRPPIMSSSSLNLVHLFASSVALLFLSAFLLVSPLLFSSQMNLRLASASNLPQLDHAKQTSNNSPNQTVSASSEFLLNLVKTNFNHQNNNATVSPTSGRLLLPFKPRLGKVSPFS